MLKKITLLLLLCSFWSCGYTPLYLKKNNLERPIKITIFKGDKKINKAIMFSLGIVEDKNIESGYTLKLNSTKKIEVISKSKSGNPSVYRTLIIVDFLIHNENTTIKQKKFMIVSSFKPSLSP